MGNKELAIVICTYNRAHFLKHNLNNLRTSTFDKFKIVVVDDGSTDDTKSVVDQAAEYLDIHYIFIPKKEGYTSPAKARNVGWLATDTPYVSFTDPEVIVPVDYIEHCYNYHLKNNKSITALKPIMVTEELTNFVLNLDGDLSSILQIPHTDFTDDENKGIQKRKSWRDNHFSMMPREAIEVVNGVNEKFDCWGFEGIDFIERMMKAGYTLQNFIKENKYVYHLYHFVDRNMDKANNQRVQYGTKNCGTGD